MPDAPDFDRIARTCFGDDPITIIPSNALKVGQTIRLTGSFTESPMVARVAEALRQVWNARGAADIAKVEAELYADGTSRPGLTTMLDRAMRTLDRQAPPKA